MELLIVLLVFNFIVLVGCAIFSFESIQEHEPRAPQIGAGIAGMMVILTGITVWVPASRVPMALGYGIIVLVCIGMLIRTKSNPRALAGSTGYAVGEFDRFDERDVVFARNRSLRPDSEEYRRFYEMHPEWEAVDAERRAKGGPVGRMGAIDDGFRPNVAMIAANFSIPPLFGSYATPGASVDAPAEALDPQRATEILKGFARHLGADLVGVCRVNPKWVYSHRGEIFYDNWEDWGAEIPAQLPYAVVIATEMNHQNVGTGPHTPAVMESAYNYAKGAFITTILAQWFVDMGHSAVAQHSRHYDLNIVPLAIDAGLGELGRFGYLISEKFGPRVRLFAVTTDMPLIPDKPIDIGVEEFCRRCMKCADSCPSKSIPHGEKTVVNGVEKWKLNAETCFDYWGKVGTDCSICMGICPYSRPNRSVHRLARLFLKRSSLAQQLLPSVDNLIYGKRWKPKPAPDWLDYSASGGKSQ